jgi:hypothetical protein
VSDETTGDDTSAEESVSEAADESVTSEATGDTPDAEKSKDGDAPAETDK